MRPTVEEITEIRHATRTITVLRHSYLIKEDQHLRSRDLHIIPIDTRQLETTFCQDTKDSILISTTMLGGQGVCDFYLVFCFISNATFPLSRLAPRLKSGIQTWINRGG
jgi:hypothetical protein